MDTDIVGKCRGLIEELDADALATIICSFLSTDDLVTLVHDEIGYDEEEYPELEEWYESHCR